MKVLADVFIIYFHNAKNAVARSMEFRADFAIGLVTSFLFSMIGPVVQYLVFRITRGYPGWSVSQMIVFQAVILLQSGITETLIGGVGMFIMRVVRKGDFDNILMKPIDSAGSVLASGFSFQSVGTIVAGIVILAIAVPASGGTVTAPGIIVFLLFLPCAILFQMAVTLLFCSITVCATFTVRINEVFRHILEFAYYPVEVYPSFIRIVYLVAVPFAVFYYFPAQALLGRLDWIMIAGGVMSIVLSAASLAFWNRTVKNYTSAGG